MEDLIQDAEKIEVLLKKMPELTLVQTDLNEPLASSEVVLREDESTRLGISNLAVETTLAMRYGSGITVANIWEGDYKMPIVLKSDKADRASLVDLKDELIPVAGGLTNVPLRQVADVVPAWKNGQIVRRNGIYTVTVQGELQRGENGMVVTALVTGEIERYSVCSRRDAFLWRSPGRQ